MTGPQEPQNQSAPQPLVRQEEVLIGRLVELSRLRLNLEERFGGKSEAIDQQLLNQHLLKLQGLESALLNYLISVRAESEKSGSLTVAVVGDFGSGKSTLINALLGENFCPVAIEPTTSVVTQFRYGERFAVEEELPSGKRRETDLKDYTDRVQHKGRRRGRRRSGGELTFHIRCPSQILTNLCLIDTPGFGNPKNETVDNARTMRAVQSADAIFVILDANKGNPSAPLVEQIKVIRGTGEKMPPRPVFLLVNKAELKPRSERSALKKKNERSYLGLFKQIELVSALELSKAPDEPVLASVRSHFARIEKAIRSRQNIESVLSASKDQTSGTYQVVVDGNPWPLPAAAREDLATREDLKSMLEQVRLDRIPLLADRLRREISSLRDDWKDTLNELRRWLNHQMPEVPVVGQNVSLLLSSHINFTRNEVGQVLSVMYKEASNKMFSPAVEVAKGILFDDQQFGIVFDPGKLYSALKFDKQWDTIKQSLKDFRDGIFRIFNVVTKINSQTGKDLAIACLDKHLPQFRKKIILDHLKPSLDSVFERQLLLQKAKLEDPRFFGPVRHFPSAWVDKQGERDRVYAGCIEYGETAAEDWAKDFIDRKLMPNLNDARDEVIRTLAKRAAHQALIAEDLKMLRECADRLFHSAL